MKIADVTLSYPILEYPSIVTHVTARESIAFEWLFLQAVVTIESHPEYGIMSVEEFFSGFFGISETDIMLKQSIIELIHNFGALKSSIPINDDTRLEKIPMSAFSITEDGRKMQYLGKLPGKRSQNSIQVYYDPVRSMLWLKKYDGQHTDLPAGIDMMNINADEVIYPTAEVIRLINELRDNPERRLNWMAENTEISDVAPRSAALRWRNERCSINLGENMMLTVEGQSLSPEDEEKVLSHASASFLSESTDLPQISFDSPDEQIEKLTLLNDTESSSGLGDFNEIMYIADARYCPADMRKGGKLFKNAAGTYIEIICGSDKFSYNMRQERQGKKTRKIFTVCVPEEYLHNGIAFAGMKKCYGVGRMTFSSAYGSYPADVMYIPVTGFANEQVSAWDILKQVVEAHYKEQNELIFLLYAFDIGIFRSYIEKVVGACSSIEEKISRITALNDISNKMIDKKYISDELMARMLAGEKSERTVSEAISLLEYIAGQQTIRKNDSLMRLLIRYVIGSVSSVSGTEELYELLDTVIGFGKNYESFILKNWDICEHLYSEKITAEIIGSFSDDDLFRQFNEYTQAEATIFELRRICDDINAEFPELSVFERCSRDSFTELVTEHRAQLKTIHRYYSRWKEELERFRGLFGDADTYCGYSKEFSNAVSAFEKLGEALGRFYCDTDSFKMICIADTCALINCPHIIERFDKMQNNSVMLIIPQTVLEELDGLKKNQDNGHPAREVIKSIQTMLSMNKSWLNVSESSSAELLPEDFDSTLADNKILSVALRYLLRDPILLTDDVNLMNKSRSLGLKTMNCYEFFDEMKAKCPANKNSGGKSKRRKK